MPDMGSISAAISSLKTAADLAKGFFDLKEAAAVQGKVIELQRVILNAQSSALEGQSDQQKLHDRIRELETELAKLEGWEKEKGRYVLRKLPPGVYVYSLKKEAADREPPHHLCAKCFNNGKKAILQESGIDYMKCHECGSEFYPHHTGRSVTVENSWDDFD
jgi:Zn finger protein HypA/HybF involved in hydrogenase expression